jgi:DNA-binding NtrC family response regulator
VLESELFGHVRGSFTGAFSDHIGKLRTADTGTIFLDEIGEMTLRMQALLLRFLENGEIQPVGSDTQLHCVDVRVIAATNRDLRTMVSSRAFRQDLLFRLNVINLYIPPLRERREDIRPLVAHLLATTGRRVTFSEEALQALERGRWPGNVRELQNVVERMAVMTAGPIIGIENLPPDFRADGALPRSPVADPIRSDIDALYEGLVTGRYAFWDHAFKLFLHRDLTRDDLRHLVRRGLAATSGSYFELVALFGMAGSDYKRFMNALSSHDCMIDFRPFRRDRHRSDKQVESAFDRDSPFGTGEASGP